MPVQIVGLGIGDVWERLLYELAHTGERVAPRKQPIREHRDVTLRIDNARNNILLCPVRKPNYRFMVAEWLWIWFGRKDVASIVQYNPKIAAFSDDGKVFAGAYGPRIQGQWQRAVRQLDEDPDTRQAIIQIFDHEKVLGTRDVACTLALQFMIRDGQLHTTAYMRSSDVWLGLPYDTFTFAMLGNIMASYWDVEVGSLTFHLGSSHLYEINYEKALDVFAADAVNTLASPKLGESPNSHLEYALVDPNWWNQTNGPPMKQPWEDYAACLTATTREEVLNRLMLIGANGGTPIE